MDYTAFSSAEQGLLELLQRLCKPRRVAHSVSVAEVAARLCARFGIDPALGRIAGLAHDIVKDTPASELWPMAFRLGNYPETERLLPLLEAIDARMPYADKVIHGPAGAVFLLEARIVKDESVLGAVASHSTARPGMTSLEKIVFSADKLEPLRAGTSLADAEALLNLGEEDLFAYALSSSLSWLSRAGLPVAQATVDLYNALQRGAKRA
ncbi:MAG TPA: bis(5'-nucleosyl)-tetraphosphatase (symmetrical) YqeK [Rectinemataceae bacterium]